MNTVKFMNWECKIKFAQYRNQRIAMELVDHITHEPIAVVTINLPDVPLESDEVIIKNYSENTTMDVVLVNAGIIGPPLRFVQTGFVTVPICKLLINPNMS
jgi:hypothetical protein